MAVMDARHVVVIGAGFTGLAAGYELTRRGHRVTVLEADSAVGGLAGSFPVDGGERLEKFYHHWFTSDEHIFQLIDELGESHRVLRRPTHTGMYHTQRIHRLSTPLDVLRFSPLPFLDRIRLGLLALRARRVRDWRALEDLTAGEWLSRLGGRRVYRVVWEPLLRGKFGPYADDVSAVWMWNKLKLRGGSRGRGGAEVLCYYRGGFAALAESVRAAIEAGGGQVLTGRPAERLLVEDGAVRGVVAGETIRADAVIATPAPAVVADLVDGARAGSPGAGTTGTSPDADGAPSAVPPGWLGRLRGIDYLANLCLVLELDRPLSDTYWLNVNDPSFPFVGVIEHTNFEPSATYGGRHIVYLSKYLPHDDPLFRMSDDGLLAFSMPHLRRMFPAFDTSWVLRHHVWRARWAQPVVVRHYSEHMPAAETPLPGLFLSTMAQIYPEDRGTNYAVREGRSVARLVDEKLKDDGATDADGARTGAAGARGLGAGSSGVGESPGKDAGKDAPSPRLPVPPSWPGEKGGAKARGARWWGALLALLVVTGGLIIGAMRHTSMTFDELGMMAEGVRAVEVGKVDMNPDQPPVMKYLYGLAVRRKGMRIPAEVGDQWGPNMHYAYGQVLFFKAGNNPERLAFRGRLLDVAIALLLVLLVFLWTRRVRGDPTALLAAGLVAFLPDLLAHGGVAYNDVPMAAAYFGAAWALDAVVRRPTLARAALAGGLATLALGIKFSALALAPVAVVLLVAEAVGRGRDRAWWIAVAKALPVALVAAYIVLAAIYRFDWGLADFRERLLFNIHHAEAGHGAAAVLLGHQSLTGFWYFFPVAFLFKTPAALHILIVVALLGALRVARRPSRETLRSPMRMPVVAGLVFLYFLLTSHLNIGFRHALPLLPMLLVLTAAGVAPAWRSVGRWARVGIGALLVWYAASTVSYYPDFLAYLSEYAPSRDRGYEILVDSSLDWGQGLLELRSWMHDHDVKTVYLSYFGSALPEGYGIHYVALPSFFPLFGGEKGDVHPEYVVVSATNLAGNYIGDQMSRFRRLKPDAVLGHTMFVYRLR